MAAKKLFDWGDGKGKIHTIPQTVHKQNVSAAQYGINLDAPVSAPQTVRTVYGQAQQAADLQYNPVIQGAQSLQASIPGWFDNYKAGVAAAQTSANQYAQPVLTQAANWANQPTTAAPGLDPNSAAGQQSAQAAQSGSGLAKLGADVLGAVQNTTTGYLAGQSAQASQQLPVAQQYAAQQVTSAKAQHGAAVADNYGKGLQNAQNADIAYSTLNLNSNKAAADVDLGRGVDPVTGKSLPKDAPTGYSAGGPGLNKYGYTADEWASLTPAQQAKERKGTDTTAQKKKEKEQAAQVKKEAAIKTASGKTQNSITDITEYRQSDVGQVTDDTSKKPDTQGNYPTRKVTQADIDAEKVRKYGTLGRIAIAVRDGKALTPEQVAYLHQRDPNFRVPREWIKGKSTAPPVGRPIAGS